MERTSVNGTEYKMLRLTKIHRNLSLENPNAGCSLYEAQAKIIRPTAFLDMQNHVRNLYLI